MLRVMIAAVVALAAFQAAAQTAPFVEDADWPCQQRKVVRLSMGQVWSGPIPDDMTAWSDDPQIAAAATTIAARRTAMAEVAAIIDAVAAGADRDARLTALFTGVFVTIDRQRAQIIDGITRYVLKQRALSERVDAQQVDLARLEAQTAPDDFDALDRIDELRDQVLWDVRIYEEKRRSLLYVCESPVILEQRAFTVGRMIAAKLGDG